MLLPLLAASLATSGSASGSMRLVHTITGHISPKSIVHSGTGLFFAQNMMYTHYVTVYDRDFNLVKTISDKVELSRLGQPQYRGRYQGSPVECAFTADGREAWVSNYQMYGPGFNHPGFDASDGRPGYDPSFLFRIDTTSLTIRAAVKVGSVPKYVAVTPDGQTVLVSNWASYDLSVVSPSSNREIKRIRLGRFPRGIAVAPSSRHAYVAVMGSTSIADVALPSYQVTWLRNVGRSPRHLCLDGSGRWLYATLNGEGRIAKIDLTKRRPVGYAHTGSQPRSMVLTPDGSTLYVVNYDSSSFSRVRTGDMKVTATLRTNHHPIGITYDPQTRRVWVACYSGTIMVFQDQ